MIYARKYGLKEDTIPYQKTQLRFLIAKAKRKTQKRKELHMLQRFKEGDAPDPDSSVYQLCRSAQLLKPFVLQFLYL